MEKRVITIENINDAEYDGKPYKKIEDTDGLYWNVKQGRGGQLKEKWPLLKRGAVLDLVLGDFKGKKYIQDFELVSDQVAKRAIEQQGEQNYQKQISIESQTAARVAADLIIADKLDILQGKDLDISLLKSALLRWLLSRLMPFSQGEAAPVQTSPVKKEESPVIIEAKKLGAVETEKKITIGMIRTILAKKGYKTEAEQKKMLFIEDFGKLKTQQDLQNALSMAQDLVEKTK